MSIRSRAVIAALLLAISSAARSDGIYNPTANSVGAFDGINGNNAAGGGGGCSDALIFNVACNSMYIPIIH
jgi:hypothetical protein